MHVLPLFPNELAEVKNYSTISLSPHLRRVQTIKLTKNITDSLNNICLKIFLCL